MKLSLVLVLITTLSAIARHLLIPYLKEQKTWVWVKQAVYAVEFLTKESGAGAIKKEYVIDFIKNTIKINISDETLDTIIEAVVSEMNKFKKSSSL